MTSDRYSERARTLRHLADLRSGSDDPLALDRCLRLVVGDDALASRSGQLLVVTIVNLAARLCDRVDLRTDAAVPIGSARLLVGSDRIDGSSLVALAQRIWAGSYTASSSEPVDVTVGIGAVDEPVDLGVGVDSAGAAVVRRGAVQPIEVDDAPIAALVSAALGIAQASKLLYPTLLAGRVDDVVRLARGPFGALLDSPAPRIPGGTVVAGIGAIGSATLYALLAADAAGSIVITDPDVVRDRDLTRYVLFDNSHLEKRKVDAAADLAAGTPLTVDPHPCPLGTYLDEQPSRRLEARLVLSLVDSYEQRHNIAAELPMRILNAGTADRDLTVSDHGFADRSACLGCLYPPRRLDVDRVAVIARELRLEPDEVRRRELSKEPMTLDTVRAIARSQGRDATAYDEFADDPLDSFYRRVCGTTAISVDRSGETFAPIAFLPALAGFLVASALLVEGVDHRHFRLDAFDGLATPRRRTLPVRPDCDLCGRDALVATYRQKWGVR